MLTRNSTCNTQPGDPPRLCEWRRRGEKAELLLQLQLLLQPGPWSFSHHLWEQNTVTVTLGGPLPYTFINFMVT